MSLNINLQLIAEAVLERRIIDRELCVVRSINCRVRKRIPEVDRGIGCTGTKFSFRTDLPEIFNAQTVKAVWELMLTAQSFHVIAIGFFVKKLVRVGFI